MERYCPYCMNPILPGQPCSVCGRDPEEYHPEKRQLPPGTLLQDRYLLGRSLGSGGFGITKRGLDIKLERRVAVKEYFPTVFLKREATVTLDVTCYTASGEAEYAKGREQFLREARTMAALEEIPEIVRVLDYFPEHNTAYIVMEFLEGKTFKEITQEQGPCPAKDLLPMVEPVIRAMAAMHEKGVIHRDISPDNLMLLKNGTVKLMDFGCARDIGGDATMTTMLKEGFAPYEQYTGHGQGAWSDLYSLCATLYYCLTGRVPVSAIKRSDEENDALVPPRRLGTELTEAQERALMKGLAVRAEDRWQSMGELYGALYGVTPDGQPWTPPEDWGATEPVPSPTPEHDPTPKPEKNKKAPLSRGAKGGIAAACAAVVLTAVLVGSGILNGDRNQNVISSGDASQLSQGIDTSQEDEENGQAEDSSRLNPGGLLIPDASQDTEENAQSGEDAQGGEAEETTSSQPQNQGGGTGAAQPSSQPSSGGQSHTTPSGGQSQTQTAAPQPEPEPEPEPEPVPTKAELESQVESYLASNQFSQAAQTYRQMNDLGYISTEKLGSSLVEVGGDAEYYWTETDYGNNSSPYVKLAFDLYTEAAGLGCTQAYSKLAYCYDYGRYVSRDPAQACQWWTRLANTGDGPACYFVAEYYADGNGVPQDIPTAIDWLNKCLEYGASYMESDARELLAELQGG